MMGYGNGYGYDGYGSMMDGGAGWVIGLVLLIFGALFVALIVVLILWAIRASHGHGQSRTATTPPASSGSTMSPESAGHHEAVAIAKRRLASGEITPEQYAEIMRHLG